MTPKQYQHKAIDLVRAFGPDDEQMEYHAGNYMVPNDPRGPMTGVRFKFSSGLEVHLSFSYRSKFGNKFSEWIHFALFKLGEEVGRKIYFDADYVWWKWNIHMSGTPAQVRHEMLIQLEHRLERCAQHGAIK